MLSIYVLRQKLVRGDDISRKLWHLTQYYAYKYEPHALLPQFAAYPISQNTFQVILQFPDQCPRRSEMAVDLGKFIEQQNTDFSSALAVNQDQAREKLLTSGSLWTDGHGYDAAYWPEYHKAVRGDAEALYWVAELMKKDQNEIGAAIHYRWAENCSTDAELKAKARNQADQIISSLHPSHLETYRHSQKTHYDFLSSFDVPCLP